MFGSPSKWRQYNYSCIVILGFTTQQVCYYVSTSCLNYKIQMCPNTSSTRIHFVRAVKLNGAELGLLCCRTLQLGLIWTRTVVVASGLWYSCFGGSETLNHQEETKQEFQSHLLLLSNMAFVCRCSICPPKMKTNQFSTSHRFQTPPAYIPLSFSR
jgi:hypothetical protein